MSMEIPLGGRNGAGKSILVDDSDYGWLNDYKWHLHTDGGATTTLHHRHVPGENRKVQSIKVHRLIAHPVSDSLQVDHINHDRLDNRRSNLRVCTRQQNNRNLPLMSRNKSGYKGVSWHKGAKKWRATIKANYRQVHLGFFADPREAARAYNAAATEYYGEFAHLNEVA